MASHREPRGSTATGLATRREQNQGPGVILSASRSRTSLDLAGACEEVTEGTLGGTRTGVKPDCDEKNPHWNVSNRVPRSRGCITAPGDTLTQTPERLIGQGCLAVRRTRSASSGVAIAEQTHHRFSGEDSRGHVRRARPVCGLPATRFVLRGGPPSGEIYRSAFGIGPKTELHIVGESRLVFDGEESERTIRDSGNRSRRRPRTRRSSDRVPPRSASRRGQPRLKLRRRVGRPEVYDSRTMRGRAFRAEIKSRSVKTGTFRLAFSYRLDSGERPRIWFGRLYDII